MNKIIASSLLVAVAATFSPFAFAQQFIDISKGGNQICAVTSDNELICSTSSAAARLEPPESVGELMQVEVGDAHACGLSLSGEAICWGDNNFGQLDAPASTVFVSIDAGWNHTCGTTAEFETVCWGLADNGRLDVPTDGLPFDEIDASLVNTCGLEAAGGIRCWGVSEFRFDPPSAEADILSFAATATNSPPTICALLSDGSVECNSDRISFPGVYTDIAGLGFGVCALTTAAEVECQSTTTATAFALPELAASETGAAFVELFDGAGLCAIDANGGISCSDAARTPGQGGQPGSNFIALPNIDPEAPSAVDDLTVSVYSETTIELFWTSIRKGGDGRVVGAEVYRDGALLTQTNQSNSYLDTTLEPGIDYSYEVRIINSRGAVGPSGNLITVNTSGRSTSTDSTYVRPPRTSTPENLNALIYSDTVLELVWDRSNNNVFGYEIYKNHEYLGFVNGTSYLDETLMPGSNYHYDVLAVDRDGDILGFDGVEVGGN